MTANSVIDATGTKLLYAEHARYAAAAAWFWEEQEPTLGYALRSTEPWMPAVRHVEVSSRFPAIPGSFRHTVLIHHELERDVDILFFWNLSATVRAVEPDPSLIEDLASLWRQQWTSYRIVVRDALGYWRAALTSWRVQNDTFAEGRVELAPVTVGIWGEQLAELKQLADLTNDQLAQLFGVSRTSIQGWLAGGGMRGGNRDHLRQTLDIFQDAYQRQGSSQQLHETLMTPVGERRRRPFDYLAEKQYAIARGYLQRRPGAERHRERQPIKSSGQRPEADRLENLEQLNPSPRAGSDDQ